MLEMLAQAVNDSSANSRLLFARYQGVSDDHCMRLLGRWSDRALSAENEFEGTTRGKASGDMERM